MSKNWKTIKDEREKYAAYLASREWSVLKEAVHKRANGICERCRVFPIDAVHHTTYARKYRENLDDLEGNCGHCHAFTHAKSHRDPQADARWIQYIRKCKNVGKRPVDHGIAWGLAPNQFMTVFRFLDDHAEELYGLAGNCPEDAADYLSEKAHDFEICADIIQAAIEQDYILWIRMKKPEPLDWAETWADAI